MSPINPWLVDEIIRRALAEDVGSGDLTTNSTVPEDLQGTGVIHAKATGVLAGVEVAVRAFQILDPDLRFEVLCRDGEQLLPGTVIARVSGSVRSILTGERVALNFLQHLSGIASRTAGCVALIKDYGVNIVDTRKTTPGLRYLAKYAVRVGGGKNHRFGLGDGVLIKDNHIAAAGGIREAIAACRQSVPHTIKIEVEVESMDQAREAVAAGADIILLDNMPPDTMREVAAYVAGRALLEASGKLTEADLVEVAKTGVDLISIGALTHSVTALDISLDLGRIKIKE
jgi:nicotinate-nucleotide pyrophosphorylase (carboxylating)